MHIASIGIDLGETTFHLVAPGEHNKILLRRKFTRSQLLAYTANLPASLIGLEAKAPSQAIATHRRVYRIEDTQAIINVTHLGSLLFLIVTLDHAINKPNVAFIPAAFVSKHGHESGLLAGKKAANRHRIIDRQIGIAVKNQKAPA